MLRTADPSLQVIIFLSNVTPGVKTQFLLDSVLKGVDKAFRRASITFSVEEGSELKLAARSLTVASRQLEVLSTSQMKHAVPLYGMVILNSDRPNSTTRALTST